MYSIIYKSKAKPDFNSEAIFKMLLNAKNFNRKKDISGCIVYYDNQFIQLIEGQEKEVSALYESIKADERHDEVTTLIKKPVDGRLWSDWYMAFYDLSGNDKSTTEKRNLLEIYFDTADTSEGSQEVFKTFRQSIYDLLID